MSQNPRLPPLTSEIPGKSQGTGGFLRKIFADRKFLRDFWRTSENYNSEKDIGEKSSAIPGGRNSLREPEKNSG
jgi:hypothetical protein